MAALLTRVSSVPSRTLRAPGSSIHRGATAASVGSSCRRRRACPSKPTTASAEGAASPAAETASDDAADADDDDAWGPWDPPLPPLDPHPPILSWYVARDLIEEWSEIANSAEDTVIASLDFDVSTVELRLTEDGVRFPDADPRSPPLVTWPDVVAIAQDEKGAYVLREGERAERFQVFSEGTSRAVSLMPSGPGSAPTALIAGFSMHRFGVGVDPMEDTARKIAAVAPIRKGARVLDICTGLAYTASMARERGGDVTTVELDPAMTEMCRMNPHSAALFSGDIRQLYGNAADVVPTLPDESFDRIIHDPPTFALAGELFSEEFYGHLARILRKKGRLYHYIGDPASKSAGNVARGVVTRLKQAGFGGVAIDYDAHGIVATLDGPVKINGSSKPRGQKYRGKDQLRNGKGGAPGKGGGGKRGGGGRGAGRREKRGGRGGGGRRGAYDDDDDIVLPK